MSTKYVVYHPDTRQELGTITGKKASKPPLQTILDQIERGVATEKAKAIRCIPIGQERVKEKDVKTLETLFGKRRNRGTNEGLTPITEEIRLKGTRAATKVNWETERPFIEDKIEAGWTVTQIAKTLGVTKSTLSMANRRYSFYDKKPSPVRSKNHKTGKERNLKKINTGLNGLNSAPRPIALDAVQSSVNKEGE